MKNINKLVFIIVFFILLIISFSNFYVYADEDYSIKIYSNKSEWTTSDVMIMIEILTNKVLEVDENIAVQILLGEESETNKWIDLGSGSNINVIKKPYSYVIKKNVKVSVRIISWKNQDKSDIQQLAIQTYDVSNIDKTNPIIDNVLIDTTDNGITLDIKAKDNESGILKYSCICDELNMNQNSENSKFVISNLEANRDYKIKLCVEDKTGNKVIEEKTIKTKIKEEVSNENIENVVENTIDNNVSNTNLDVTISNQKIPDVGSQRILLLVFLLSMYTFLIELKEIVRR